MARFKGERHKFFLNCFAVIINSTCRKSFNDLFLARNVVLKIYELLDLFRREIFLHCNFYGCDFLNRDCFLGDNFLRRSFLSNSFLGRSCFLCYRFLSNCLFSRSRLLSSSFAGLGLVFERTKYSHNCPLVFSNYLRNFCFELLEAMSILYSRLGGLLRQLPRIQLKSHRVQSQMRS